MEREEVSTISSQYDSYLEQHKANVKKGFEWIREHIPDILQGDFDYEWQICLNHDHSKTEPDEYEAYDAYFYGGNRSFDVVQNFNKAWLLHIHRNPHHWQHWVLINDEPNEGEIVIQMPINYIVEMICDWWAFSWSKGDLTEMFSWYEERKNYIKMHKNTRKTVEDIFTKIKEALNNDLSHHGIKGQKWGVRNGPPYPIKRLTNAAGVRIIEVDKNELTGPPNGITQHTNRKGGIDRNYYDENGRQIKQISNNDHFHPKQHNYGEHGEHAHDYIYNDSGELIGRPHRKLTESERKENSDIL